jgi:hypothetical protein
MMEEFYGQPARENIEYWMPRNIDVRVAVYQHDKSLVLIGEGNRRFHVPDAQSIYRQLRDILEDDTPDDAARQQSP